MLTTGLNNGCTSVMETVCDILSLECNEYFNRLTFICVLMKVPLVSKSDQARYGYNSGHMMLVSIFMQADCSVVQ